MLIRKVHVYFQIARRQLTSEGLPEILGTPKEDGAFEGTPDGAPEEEGTCEGTPDGAELAKAA